MNNERKPNYLFIGMMSVFVGHVILIALAYVVAFFLDKNSPGSYIMLMPFAVLACIGIAQLVYVIPLGLWLRHKRRLVTMQGVIIGAVFTALLNGVCYLLFAI